MEGTLPRSALGVDGMVNSNAPRPIMQWKRDDLPRDERDGVVYLGWDSKQRKLLGRLFPQIYYTRLDQALLLWAIAVAVIFFTAQFHAFDWHHQARVWSGLSLSVLVFSSVCAWSWAVAKNARWVIFLWAGITLVGLGLTDYGIYRSVIPILLNLCPLWLGLCAVGYGVTAVGMESRALLGIVVLHGVALGLLRLWPAWPFLITGGVISGCLLLLAQFEWDHR